MTSAEITSAIDGWTFEDGGRTWTLKVDHVESRPPHALAVTMQIEGISNHDAVLNLSAHNPRDERQLRDLAVNVAREIISGRLPPGARTLL